MTEESGNGNIALAEEPPRRTSSELSAELGATGTRFYRGSISDQEFNTKLKGKTAIETYYKMLTDAQVKASIRVVTLPLKAATWTLASEDEALKEEINEALFERLNFDTVLSHLLLALPYGFEIMEKVYTFEEGRFWYADLAHRGQDTIDEWLPGPGTCLAGIRQVVYKEDVYSRIEIPADKLVHIAFDQIGNNFAGTSALRSAYKYWFIKEEVERVAAIAAARYGSPPPIVKAPESYDDADKAAAQRMGRNWTSGNASHIFLPYGWDVTFPTSLAGARYDSIPLIRYCDQMIAMNVLAMALTLGTTETGSRALGESMFEMFFLALEGHANWIQKTINSQIIDPLLALNHPNVDPGTVRIEWADLELKNIERLTQNMERLQKGGFLQPDPQIEDYMRDLAGLPAVEAAGGSSAARAPGGHRHLAEVTEPYWRPRTELEKSMALAEIDGHQDDAQTELTEILIDEKAIWVEDLIRQARDAVADGDASDVADVSVSTTLRNASKAEIVRIERETYRYGRGTVRDEQKRQARRARRQAAEFRDEPLEDPEVTELFNTRAAVLLKRMTSRLEGLTIERALALHRTKGVDATDEDWDDLSDTLVGLFEPTIRMETRVLVAESFNLGRNKQAEAMKETIARAIYSAILDDNLCDVCARLDGEEYEVGSVEYLADSPPNAGCLSTLSGSNGCRCLWIYEFE